MEIFLDAFRREYDYNSLTGELIRTKDSSVVKSKYMGFAAMQGARANFVWFHYYGKWPLNIIDHKDQDGENDRIENLREATTQQNSYNVRSRGPYNKGVTFDGSRKKCWRAQIRIEGIKVNLGRFENYDDAVTAYREAAYKHHGEFACVD